MFNANNGNQKIADQVDERTDEFAALFDDLSPRKQLVIINKMNELLGNDEALDAFAAGTYAQDSSGQPARALGGGSNGDGNDGSQSGNQSVSEQEALDVLMSSPVLSGNVKNALRRLLNPRDPEVIVVENDGTPSDVVALTAELRRERDPNQAGSLAHKAKEAERKQQEAETELAGERDDSQSGSLAHKAKEAARKQQEAETKLSDERDANKAGSLAKQLADAQAAAAVPADSVRKSDALQLIDAIGHAEADLDTGMMSSRIDGRDELRQAIDGAKQRLS